MRCLSNISFQKGKLVDGITWNCKVTIAPANKEGTIVVMDMIKYEMEIKRQLNDIAVYERLSNHPKCEIMMEIH